MPDEPPCCGASIYHPASGGRRPSPSYWYWQPSDAEEIYLGADCYCPSCGAHLLPGGGIERRGEVVGEAELCLDAFGGVIGLNYKMATSPGWADKWRVLLVRAEERESDA